MDAQQRYAGRDRSNPPRCLKVALDRCMGQIMGNEDEDRAAFQALWTLWKAGKGKPEAEAEKRKLLATATILLGGAAEGHCEASLRWTKPLRGRGQ
jgi:hypothetical protein